MDQMSNMNGNCNQKTSPLMVFLQKEKQTRIHDKQEG